MGHRWVIGPSPSSGCMKKCSSAVPSHSRKEEITSVTEKAEDFPELGDAHVLSLRRENMLDTFLFLLSGKKPSSLAELFTFCEMVSSLYGGIPAHLLFHREREIKQFRKVISGPLGSVY